MLSGSHMENLRYCFSFYIVTITTVSVVVVWNSVQTQAHAAADSLLHSYLMS